MTKPSREKEWPVSLNFSFQTQGLGRRWGDSVVVVGHPLPVLHLGLLIFRGPVSP